MEPRKEAIERLRNRLSMMLTLRWAVALAAGVLFAWGLGVLIARTVWDVRGLWLVVPAVLVVAVIPVAWGLARRRVPTASAIRAMLDGASGCGGLLMAAEDHDLGAWSQRVGELRDVSIRWRGQRSWAIFAVAAIFVIVAMAMPNPQSIAAGSTRLQINDQTDKLTAQLDVLEKEKILDHQRAQAMKEKLEQLRQEASGDNPVNTLDPLDHLENQIAQAAREAAEKALAQTQQLARAQALAQGLQQDLGKMDPQTATEAAKELAQMAADAAADNQALKEMLDKPSDSSAANPQGDDAPNDAQLTQEQLREACRNGKLSAEQIAQLAKALKECKGDLAQTLQELSDAGLIDPEALKQCQELGLCRGGQETQDQSLADYLSENADQASVAELVAAWSATQSGRPGRGGISRGRADAAMTWSDGTDPQGMTFKEQALTPGAIRNLKDSRLAGISVGAPGTDTPSADGQGSGLQNAQSGSGGANTQTILPRHRGTVKRYFDREPSTP